ncbi:hypothetical protein PCANC_06405 [Puccinia coronata f. sp. avenae]|uniref:Uncharacterized protein n=1 Tax=Puccinia coronata f. sp. avenae TaxID=200324 RepID=A0A2N5T5C5_9BASI|nr:hypothetical protein PCANC_07384 [Puccinia coronata f. sp. avenae]PLW54118.1 hypothetical protein PCANC_06405 [Puccinia coronata f. sp. avenae]
MKKSCTSGRLLLQQPRFHLLPTKQSLGPSCYSVATLTKFRRFLLAGLVPAQRTGYPAHQARTSTASRLTCSPSWYQPREQVNLLTELVPAPRAGLPAHRAGTSPASRLICSPSWYQPSEQVNLLTKLVPAHQEGVLDWLIKGYTGSPSCY